MNHGSPAQHTTEDFARAWNAIQLELHAWLAAKRFAARPAEVADIFAAAEAEVRGNDWKACRREDKSKLGFASSTNKLLMAAFSRAVRAIEIKKWSQLILGSDHFKHGKDHKPSGPLLLPDTWHRRLPAPWNTETVAMAAVLETALGELALSGWAVLGGYGLHADPGEHFLEQLRLHLHRHGTWEGVLMSAMVTEKNSLLDVMRKQALREFNDPSDGERAFHWAIDYLVKEKFSAPNIPPVHEVSNPTGFLRTVFTRALVDFRRAAWRPDQVQRPRPDVWMRRLLGQDWIEIFHLSVKHASTEGVAERFLLGERSNAANDDSTDAEALPSFDPDAKHGTPRMTDAQRRFQERAQQIEADHLADPAVRIRAIAIWCRSYLEQVKQWFPAVSDLPLIVTNSEGEESERPLPHTERNPLAELLCHEDRLRLLGVAEQAELGAKDGGSLEDRLRAFIRAILSPDFTLTGEEVAVLRRIVDPPVPKKGRPPKDTEKQQLLSRLLQAAKAAGLDTSIFASLSVVFPDYCEHRPSSHAALGSGDIHDTP